MTGYVDHVVDATGYPIKSVIVATTPVASEVLAFVRREICLHESLVVAIDGAHLPGPTVEDHEVPARRTIQNVALFIDQRGLAAEERTRGGARFQFGGARYGRDQYPARFRLPPGIDDGAATIADHMVIPLPGLGVDRLTHGTKQFQGGARASLHVILAGSHQGADGGGRRVKDIHLVLVNDLPE